MSSPDANQRLAGRIALVTGGTRGIGRAVALAYARAGAHVVVTGRTQGALEELDDEIRSATGKTDGASLVTLNLKHGDKIDALGPSLYARFGHLDILAACAGVLGPLTPLGHVRTDAWVETMDVNLTANMRLIRTLDPLLRRSTAGRAIFVTSDAATAATAYWGPYSVAKAGLEALAKTYAHEVANTAIRVNLVDPGPVRTALRATAFPGEDPQRLRTPAEVAPAFIALADPSLTENGRLFEVAASAWRPE